MAVQTGNVALQIGSMAPDFEAETTEGRIRFHDWIGDSWAVLFSHPKDFTPVCTTELGYMARLKPEFDKRHTKIMGLSVDPVGSHTKWSSDIKETQGHAPNYPMIGDTDLSISKLYGMLPADVVGTCDGRTPADNQTVRNVFVIGPDNKIKLIIAYPMTTGRNFDEVLRVVDSLQLESRRDSRRLHSLRGWRHDKTQQVLPGSPGPRRAHGPGASAGTRLAVGSDHVDRGEDRLLGGDAEELGTTGGA